MILSTIRRSFMKRSSPALVFVLAACLLLTQSACTSKPVAFGTASPPVAKILPRKLTLHGQTRIDNYYWLNERDNPKVLKYLEAENA